MAAEVLEPIYRLAASLAGSDPRPRGQAREREAIRASGCDHQVRGAAYEEQLEDFESASKWYAKLFRGSRATRRSATSSSASARSSTTGVVAQTYQQYLDDEPGDRATCATVANRGGADLRPPPQQPRPRIMRPIGAPLAIQADDAIPNERELVRRPRGAARRGPQKVAPSLVTIYDDVIALLRRRSAARGG